LGTLQGITEWLPISSEGVLILAKTHLFNNGESLSELIGFALFLHLGTFLAAAWYLRDDVISLLKMLLTPHRLLERGEGLFRFRGKKGEMENMLRFLVVSTFVSGVIGYFLLEIFLPSVEESVMVTTKFVTGGIGIFLLITGFLEFQAKRKKGHKELDRLSDKDGLLLGVVQGFAALPGFSRSGLTISTLLLRKFDEVTALRLSFLMSLPIVFGGNIVFNANESVINITSMFGLVFSFVFGIITIHILFKIARKINFAYFVLAFGFLTIASVFI